MNAAQRRDIVVELASTLDDEALADLSRMVTRHVPQDTRDLSTGVERVVAKLGLRTGEYLLVTCDNCGGYGKVEGYDEALDTDALRAAAALIIESAELARYLGFRTEPLAHETVVSPLLNPKAAA